MIPKPIRQGVLERSNGRCEGCGQRLDPDTWECHHRKLRSQFGKDELSNLLALCLPCHVLAHSKRRAFGEPNGLIVASWQQPEEVPVLLYGAVRVHLDDEGYYAPIEESA
jgi:predicted restriction endonuclease